MTITSGSDNGSGKVETAPFPDFTRVNELNGTMFSETAKFNAQIGTTLQNMGREWSEFVGMRLHEDLQLFRTIHDCRSLQDLQQAYAGFWQKAFTQYGDEAQRMLRITQGAMDKAAPTAKDARETIVVTDKAA